MMVNWYAFRGNNFGTEIFVLHIFPLKEKKTKQNKKKNIFCEQILLFSTIASFKYYGRTYLAGTWRKYNVMMMSYAR